jgi:NADP-dependent 3-hydroxy acid dehydrogenase YdfG
MSHYFITGASAGIGAAIARHLSQSGHNVSAIARRHDLLKKMERSVPGFNGIAADVCDEVAVAAAVENSSQLYGGIDVAILNAGIYEPQDGSAINPSVYANHMNINYMGVINSLAAILPHMITAKHGHIVIISSVAGWRGLPQAAAYGPTKAALISLAESLYFDLTPKGLKIQIVCPGFVDTEATRVNTFEMPDILSAEVAAQHILDGIKNDCFSFSFPKKFARKMKVLRYLPDRCYFSLVGKRTGKL